MFFDSAIYPKYDGILLDHFCRLDDILSILNLSIINEVANKSIGLYANGNANVIPTFDGFNLKAVFL